MADEEGTRGPEVRGTPIDEPTRALVPDPLVESLVPDPSQPPPPTVTLVGLLGRSPKEGYWRLYLTMELNRYAEFKQEDVLRSAKIPRMEPPFMGLQGTIVWLKRDAEIEYTRTESRRVRAEVLQNGITMRTPIDEPPPPTEDIWLPWHRAGDIPEPQ